MNFAVIGVGGYIAPRHLDAIKAVGGKIVAAFDINDSVGRLDSHAPDVPFFTNFEKFELFLEQVQAKTPVDFVSVCSPNDLHLPHIHAGLRLGANVICEKPLVTSSRDLDEIDRLEKKYGRRVFTILQLRIHPKLVALKADVEKRLQAGEKFNVRLDYVTTRGPWYFASWKGNVQRSGGIAFNIGVHFFDLLCWLFGEPTQSTVSRSAPAAMAGAIQFAQANVDWSLSVDKKDLPAAAVAGGKTTFRSISLNGVEVEFSDGFTDLHAELYRRAVENSGFGTKELRAATALIEKINSAAVKLQ